MSTIELLPLYDSSKTSVWETNFKRHSFGILSATNTHPSHLVSARTCLAQTATKAVTAARINLRMSFTLPLSAHRFTPAPAQKREMACFRSPRLKRGIAKRPL